MKQQFNVGDRVRFMYRENAFSDNVKVAERSIRWVLPEDKKACVVVDGYALILPFSELVMVKEKHNETA